MVCIISELLGYFGLCHKMLVLSMNRDCVLWIDKRINKLYILLAGMTGNMDILEYNVCTLHHELIDDTCNRLLISRYRV